ncbi:CHAT domain-containing protein, partial [Mariprofundus sp. EBB-1]|uniref:CHAT domain-containing protein n=1 Tax=Mariprofundus sp. EBB-1 TaxID=2650971 RepID=UPI000F1CDD80
LNGCVNKRALALDHGQHKQLILELQKEGNLSGDDFTVLCRAYYRSGEYKQFFSCVDRFKSRYKNVEYDWSWSKQATTKVVGTNLFVESDLALAYFELQNYHQALEHANYAVFWIEDKHAKTTNIFDSLYGNSFALQSLRVRPLETAALASISLGQDAAANASIHKLEGITNSLHNGIFGAGVNWSVRDHARLALMRIYVQMGNYGKARELLDALENSAGLATEGFNDLAGILLSPVIAPMQKIGTGSANILEASKHNTFDMRKNIAQATLSVEIYAYSGNVDDSIKILDNILANSPISDIPSYYWVSLYNRGSYHLTKGEIEQAIVKFQKSIGVIEDQRSTIVNDTYKMGFAGDKQTVYSDLVTALMDVGRYDEAFAYAERGKARALVDMLASKKKFSGGDVLSVSEQNQLLAQLDTAEAKFRVISGNDVDRSSTRSVVIKNREALIQQAPELSSLVTVAAPDVKEIQNLLPAGETLIEYYGSGNNLFAFVVSKEGIQGVKLKAKGLAADVASFREAILHPKSAAYKTSGKKLYNRLITPISNGINGKNITIVPHGALHYVPFSALTAGKGFLIDRYNLRVLPSASVMKFLKVNKNKAGTLLALGNPDLGDKKFDLPFAEKEAIKVSKRMKGSKLLLRGSATETAIKSYGNSFKYLHFASHGTFDAEKPLNSGLLLAKDAQNDGILTVGELYDLNLNADLVTLSACETALGKIANGDDVVGFTRGFLYAGASSIVSSLWQVDDAATSVLMQSFYDNLGKTDKRSALRNAQLTTKSKYTHPYYWAAFQITGAIK